MANLPQDDPPRPLAGVGSTPPPRRTINIKDVLARAVAILAVLIAGGSLTVSLVDNDGNGSPEGVKFTVNESKGDGKPTITQEVPEPVVNAAKATLESGLKDETPPEASPDQLQKIQDVETQVKATEAPLPLAGASSTPPGCVTRFVSNQSSRSGVRPIWMVLHYTVSPNRPGWSDINAVVALFDRFSSQASSHFVIDREGNCAYIVPIEKKAWTNAAGNSLSVQWEIINSGRESSFMDTAGYEKLKSTMKWVSGKTGIPMKAGSVYPTLSGIVQHKDGGLAWGGHVDITPYPKTQVISVLTTNACNKACEKRARGLDLRKRNYTTHKELRDRNCAPIQKTKSQRCLFLHRRHRAIHSAARKEDVKL